MRRIIRLAQVILAGIWLPVIGADIAPCVSTPWRLHEQNLTGLCRRFNHLRFERVQRTAREKGAAIGTVGGAAVGGIVGSTVGRPGAGAAIGRRGTRQRALIGDQIQSLEKKQIEVDEQIKHNNLELQRQREEIEKLKTETKQR